MAPVTRRRLQKLIDEYLTLSKLLIDNARILPASQIELAVGAMIRSAEMIYAFRSDVPEVMIMHVRLGMLQMCLRRGNRQPQAIAWCLEHSP